MKTRSTMAALAFGLAASAAWAVAEAPSFDRYQIILTRRPFGQEPSETAPAAGAPAAAPAADSFIKTLKLGMLTKNDRTGLVQAGITDTKTGYNYFLVPGDADGGLELVEADYENEKVLLRKGAEQYWLEMGGASEVSDGRSAGLAPVTQVTSVVRPGGRNVPSLPSGEVHLRMRQELEEQRRSGTNQTPARAEGLSDEERRRKIMDYQMDLIRSRGKKGPPLPIPLTKEMDDQLVAEGVLPPQQ
jgi:hypothetical protein